MIALSHIYVLLPAYNEASSIIEVINGLKNKGIHNILVINDGSTDNTAQLVRQEPVHLVNHLINRGAGAAIQTGIELARHQGWPYIALMDADGQHDANDILVLKEKMEQSNCDLVVGSRFMKNGNQIPRTRIVFNFIANLMTNIFSKKKFTDSQSGLRLLNRKAIESINLELDGFGFCSEMLNKAEKADLKIEETATKVLYTKYSISKGQDFNVGITTAFNFLWNIFFK